MGKQVDLSTRLLATQQSNNKMLLTLLGTGTSQGVPIVGCTCEVCLSKDPRDNRLRTSAFLEIGEINILIDAGPDLRQQLLRSGITKIDALLVTHEHKDHIGGIDDIRPINFLMHETMEIYGLHRVMNVIAKDYDYAFKTFKYPGVPDLHLNPVKNDPFFVKDIEITPIHVKHLHLPILGYRIANFGYITDASFIAGKEVEKLMDLDVLVINALRIKEHYSHFNLEQALQVIQKLKPRLSILTHAGHTIGLYSEVEKILPEGVVLGWDGMKLGVRNI
ncbi:MAG: MBL fold metallo-hydrolase [Bacteroidales bacterium]|jgi:phosphoribosyl 1,2-cyclic phosphate phosphodiesterase|nr:MBL fold metallo-hydrolase [Bacteroidales bacterium]